MLKGSGVTADEARRGRITEKSMDADKLIAMLTYVRTSNVRLYRRMGTRLY
jgi:hypothetical protein